MGVTLKDPALPTSIFVKTFLDDSHKNVHISTCDGTVVLAHSSVLSVVSRKLSVLFAQSNFGVFRINTPNVTSKTWEIILEFIHTGSVALPVGYSVSKLYETSEALQIEPLQLYLKGHQAALGISVMSPPGTPRHSSGTPSLPSYSLLRYLETPEPQPIGSTSQQQGSTGYQHATVSSSTIPTRQQSNTLVESAGDVQPHIPPHIQPTSDMHGSQRDVEREAHRLSSPRVPSVSPCPTAHNGRQVNDDTVMPRLSAEPPQEFVHEPAVASSHGNKASSSDHGKGQQAVLPSGNIQTESITRPSQQNQGNNSGTDVGVGLMTPKEESGDYIDLAQSEENESDSQTADDDQQSSHPESAENMETGSGDKEAHDASTQPSQDELDKQKTKCLRCKHVFSRYDALLRHLKKCDVSLNINSIAVLYCKDCDVSFNKASHAASHFNEVHLDIYGFKCKVCNTVMKQSWEMRNHAAKPCLKPKLTKLKKGKSLQSPTSQNWSKNQNRDKNIKRMKVAIEKRTSSKRKSTLSPPTRKLTGRIVSFRHFESICSFCGVESRSAQTAADHLWRAHAYTKGFICKYCKSGFKSYPRLYNHITHNKCQNRESEAGNMNMEEDKDERTAEPMEYVAHENITATTDKTVSEESQEPGDLLSQSGSETKGGSSPSSHQKQEFNNHPCPKCDKSFMNKLRCNKHIRLCHSGGARKKLGVTYESPSKKILEKSKKTVSINNVMRLNCEECEYESQSAVDVAMHLRIEHGIDNCYRCKVCDKGYPTGTGLCLHVQRGCFRSNTTTGEQTVPNERSDDMQAESNETVDKTQSMDEGDDFQTMEKQPAKSLTPSSSSSSSSENEFNLSIVNHTCKECGLESNSDKDAALHQKEVNQKVGCYVCRICECRYHSYSELYDHSTKCRKIPVDTSVPTPAKEPVGKSTTCKRLKIFQRFCNICGVEGTTAVEAAKHLWHIHKIRNCYVCARCKIGCKSYKLLYTHSLQCSGVVDTDSTENIEAQKNHSRFRHFEEICPQCGHKSNTAQTAADHMNNVHNMLMGFICKYCKFGFTSYGKLYHHIGNDACRGKANVDEATEYQDDSDDEGMQDEHTAPESTDGDDDDVTEDFSGTVSRQQQGASAGVPFTHFQENCSVCKHKSSSSSEAARHLKEVHHKTLTYLCKYCTCAFRSYQGLHSHIMKNRCTGREAASDSNSRKENAEKIKQQRKTGTKGVAYSFYHFQEVCPDCGHESASVNKAANHLKNKHDVVMCYVCKYCSEGFKCYSSLERHISQGRCTEMDEFSPDSPMLDNSEVQDGTSPENSGDEDSVEDCEDLVELTCADCGHVSETADDAAMHLSGEHDIIDCFVCKVCHQGYDRYLEFCSHAKSCKKT